MNQKTALVLPTLVVSAAIVLSVHSSAATEPSAEVFAPDSGPSQLVFQRASADEQAELDEWLNDQYLPSLDMPEAHKRSEIARIDAESLARLLANSFEANGGPVPPTTHLYESESDLIFNLFSDFQMRGSVVQYTLGRHSGLIMARLRSAPSSGDKSTDNIYLEITATGVIRGVVDTCDGFFRIRQTPVIGLVVVSEMDQDAVYDELKAN